MLRLSRSTRERRRLELEVGDITSLKGGGSWDITEHGVGGLYGQTAFSSRPAGAPPVDLRFAPGAPLVAGLQPHYAVSVGSPAPAPSALGGAALPLSPVAAAPSACGLPALVVSAFAPDPASPASFSFGALPASLSGAPPVAAPSPAPFVLPPPGLPSAGDLPVWAQDPALASFLGEPPDLNSGYEEQRAPPPAAPSSLASLVSSPPRPVVPVQKDAGDEQTSVCPWASWVEYGVFGCVLLLLVVLPSLVVFTTDTSFVTPTCHLSARQVTAATPATLWCCTGIRSTTFGACAGATSCSAVGGPLRGPGTLKLLTQYSGNGLEWTVSCGFGWGVLGHAGATGVPRTRSCAAATPLISPGMPREHNPRASFEAAAVAVRGQSGCNFGPIGLDVPGALEMALSPITSVWGCTSPKVHGPRSLTPRSLSVHFLIAFLRRVPLMGPRLAAHPHWHSFSSFCFPVPLCSFGTVGGCSSRSPCCELYIAPGRAGPVSRAIYPEDPSLWGTGGVTWGVRWGCPPPFKLLS